MKARSVVLALLVSVAAACGGGGGDPATPAQPAQPAQPTQSTQPPQPAQPPAPAPAPAPPPVTSANRPPVVAKPNVEVRGLTGHGFRYDASQGGTTFTDPDGDPLIYAVSVFNWNLTAVGPWITRAPQTFGQTSWAVIVASDGRGGEASDGFNLFIDLNAPPVVVQPNGPLLTTLGAHVNHDLTGGGLTFTDANGDPLTYTVEMLSPPGRGMVVDGVRAVGALANEKMATFKITASDGYGGTATDTLIVAAPDPLPGRPTLPAQTYLYADEDFQLPWLFRESRRSILPFWDTVPTGATPVSNTGATLGRVLFYDKRLSVLNTHSCASCHEQARGFATADRFPTGVLAVPLKRNAMALANARYNFKEKWFIDLRTTSLENLALLPIQDLTELGSPLDHAIAKLTATDFYPPLFQAAFGSPTVTEDGIMLAIAQFLRSVYSYRTRFDQAFMVADPALPPPNPLQFLTPLEVAGKELFTTLRCAECHQTELQIFDAPQNNGLDAVRTDPGLDGTFRAASLRNIAVTGPYMHDGRFATLREVIDHYDHGVQDSPDLSPQLRVDNDVGPPRRLNLTAQQKDALEAFLRTLTDNALLTDPRFSDPFH